MPGGEVVLTCTDARRRRRRRQPRSAAGDAGSRSTWPSPKTIAAALSSVGPVALPGDRRHQRDDNKIRDFDIDRALELVTLKLVGYTEVVHILLDRLADSSIVLFGGLAKDRPYPGSTTVSTVNGGVVGLARTLAWELAPIRVNAIHPGIVGDSPYWARQEPRPRAIARTPTRQLATMDDIVDGTRFLLENPSVNGIDLGSTAAG